MYYLCNAYSGRLFVFRGVCLILDTEIRQIFYSEDDVTRLHLMFVVLLQPIVWVAGCNEYKRGYCSRFGIRCLAITYINRYNLLIYKIKSPLVKKAGNISVTKRLIYCLWRAFLIQR